MTTNDRSRNQRKRRALLAAGLVLGVGAVITLATWNDSVWGDSDFGTGTNSWNVQGTFDGSTWDEFVTQDDAGTMQFDLTAIDPTALKPGNTVRTIVGLRETEGNLDADVVVAAPIVDADNTLAQALQIKIVPLGDTDPGTWDGSGTPIAQYPLAAGADSSPAVTIDAGGQQWLGFEVSLPLGTNPSGLAQSVYAAWEMQATSVD